ncbi:MAG TPA: tetratricopeptide repeat protein [Methylomirabilota bacterium]|nr:tetratricopeptide repeat protein [Methylomirabilota bacterium]
MTPLWRRAAWTFVALLLLPTLALADGGGGGGGGGGGDGATPAKPKDPVLVAAVAAIEAEEFAKAIPLLENLVARDGNNADAWNWLAYATRRNGDPRKSIPLYQKALALDSRHLGAHEYIGEAYLALDELPKAKEHLARLNRLCLFGCEEYRDLKKAVEAYEKSSGKVKPARAN